MENTSSYRCEFGVCIWTSRRGWYYPTIATSSAKTTMRLMRPRIQFRKYRAQKILRIRIVVGLVWFGPGWTQPPLSKGSIHQTCHDILGGFPNIPTSGLDGLTYLAGDQQTAVATLLPAFARTCRQAWSRWPGRLTRLSIVPHILVAACFAHDSSWKIHDKRPMAICMHCILELIWSWLEGFGERERERERERQSRMAGDQSSGAKSINGRMKWTLKSGLDIVDQLQFSWHLHTSLVPGMSRVTLL